MKELLEELRLTAKSLNTYDLKTWDKAKDADVDLPDEPTPAQWRDTIGSLQLAAGDALEKVADLIEGQQRQINTLDAMLKGHRHKVSEGAYTPKPEF